MKNICNKTVELICIDDDDDDDDDCIILETDPLEDTNAYTVSNRYVHQDLVIEDEVTIIAERGQVFILFNHYCFYFYFT